METKMIKAHNLPPKGQLISLDELLSLTLTHNKHDIIINLSVDPPAGDFVSDGCSMWPDRWLGKDIYPACFWHDVRYWCGRLGDEYARLLADLELARDVGWLSCPTLARTMFIGVGYGGSEEINSPFRWGYGRV